MHRNPNLPGAIQRTLPSFACVFNISMMQSSRTDAVSPRLNSEQSEVQIFRVRFVENKSERGGRGRERINAGTRDGSGTPKCGGRLYLLDWFLRRPHPQRLQGTHIKQSHNRRKEQGFAQQFPSAPKDYLPTRIPKTQVPRWQQEISG